MIRLLIDLYITFLKIGSLAFGGGYATIPLIEKFIVLEKNWINIVEFTDVVSISQMTPGPFAINAATFVGQKIGGILGSIISTLGVVTPQTILMLILGHFLFSQNKKFKFLDWMLNGMKACVVSLIFITSIKLIHTSIINTPSGGYSLCATITFIVGFILYLKKVNLFKLIGLGAILGILINFLI